jgi:hypothetical protein
MWATYNYANFPTVYVTISGCIERPSDFTHFIDQWLQLFNNGTDYNLYFNTVNCGYINIKYAILMAHKIKQFKKKKYSNLQYSKILVANKSILILLRLIFYIESPLAPVEVYYEKNNSIVSEYFKSC